MKSAVQPKPAPVTQASLPP